MVRPTDDEMREMIIERVSNLGGPERYEIDGCIEGQIIGLCIALGAPENTGYVTPELLASVGVNIADPRIAEQIRKKII